MLCCREEKRRTRQKWRRIRSSAAMRCDEAARHPRPTLTVRPSGLPKLITCHCYKRHLWTIHPDREQQACKRPHQHGRSLHRTKQLLPRSLPALSRFHRVGSLQTLLYHLIRAIETASQRLRTRRSSPFACLQDPDRPNRCAVQVSIHQTSLDQQQQCAD